MPPHSNILFYLCTFCDFKGWFNKGNFIRLFLMFFFEVCVLLTGTYHACFDLRNIDSRKGAIEAKRPQILDSPPCAEPSTPYVPIGLSSSHLCTLVNVRYLPLTHKLQMCLLCWDRTNDHICVHNLLRLTGAAPDTTPQIFIDSLPK